MRRAMISNTIVREAMKVSTKASRARRASSSPGGAPRSLAAWYLRHRSVVGAARSWLPGAEGQRPW